MNRRSCWESNGASCMDRGAFRGPPIRPSTCGTRAPIVIDVRHHTDDMTEIKPTLYLGGYRDADDGDIPGWYKSVGATHVLCVASEIDPPRVAGITIKYLPMADDDPSANITDIIPASLEFIEDALDAGGVVLVHCRSGASRAVCVTLAVLVRRFHYTLVDAHRFVYFRRKEMNVFEPYLSQLQEWDAATRAAER